MFSLEKSFEKPLSASVLSVADKGFFISREIAPRENFSEVVNCTEKISTHSPDVYWKKSASLTRNTLDALDFENRLIRRTSGTKTINISYDADGNRVSKTVSDSTSGTTMTYYLVDTNNLTRFAQVVEELYYNGGNLETYRSYTYGSDLIAQHQLMPPSNPTQWETSYYMYDGLGTVRALTDDNGLITDSYTYSAFGEVLSQTNTGQATPNLYLYTGEQYDADLGMYFLRARYMSPEKGRMHTMDTYEGKTCDPMSLHKYTYGHANPITYTDPSGNVALARVALVVAIVITKGLKVYVRFKKHARRLAKVCAGINDAYHGFDLAGKGLSCRQGKPRFMYDQKAIYLGFEIAGRQRWLNLDCDRWIVHHPQKKRRPQSKRSYQERKRRHKGELERKQKALKRCQDNKHTAVSL